MTNKKVVVRTGEKVDISGIYRPAGARTEVIFSKGDRATPNNEGTQQRFTLIRPVKHKK